MKRIITLALICLLCLSMFTIVLPQIKAEETANTQSNGSSQSTTDPTTVAGAFAKNVIIGTFNLVTGVFVLIDGVLANWITPSNGTTPGTLTPAGTVLVNNIVDIINNICVLLNQFLTALSQQV